MKSMYNEVHCLGQDRVVIFTGRSTDILVLIFNDRYTRDHLDMTMRRADTTQYNAKTLNTIVCQAKWASGGFIIFHEI